jgi:uncharacterized protein YllA (UPF0747 family)
MTPAVLAVRARVRPGSEPPHDRLTDPVTRDLLERGTIARERFPRALGDDGALRGLADGKRRPLDPALAAAMRAYHVRLGASPASLANLDALTRGEAVAAIAGQQPAPLLGPLYALHKTASAAGLAASASRRLAARCVPLYWMHGEDSDFAEVRGATVSDAALQLHDLALPASLHRDGALVGDLPLAAVDALVREALGHWVHLPHAAAVAGLWTRASAHARDLGEVTNALLLALFAECGLVVVDPRLPEFRTAARPLLERYLAASDALEHAAREAGARLEALGGRRALTDASLESFVFEVRDGARHKVLARDARAAGAAMTLSASVALRPAVQDGVFPTVLMACGPGEIAYLAQLREVFAGVGVEPAIPAPRFGATWLPPAASALAAAAGGDPWAVVATTDQVLHALAEARVPAGLAAEVTAAEQATQSAFARLAEAARPFDASLPQLVDSGAAKAAFQLARVREGVVSKARGRMDREHPEWKRLRYVLLPSDKLQERRIASLEPLARHGLALVPELVALAEAHADALARGEHTHLLLEAGA